MLLVLTLSQVNELSLYFDENYFIASHVANGDKLQVKFKTIKK